MTDPLVLLGRLVTFDPAQPVIDNGALYIGADEKIAAVQTASDPPPAASTPPTSLDRRRDLPRADRPPQPHGLQRAAALVAARA